LSDVYNTHGSRGYVQSSKSGTQYHLFQAAVIIKGINGVLELIGGTLLMLVGPSRINHTLDAMTRGQLEDSPNGLLLKLLTNHGIVRHVGPVDFAVVYLLINGIAKIIIVTALMKRKVKAFPYAMAFLGLFVVYGVGRLFTHHSVVLAIAMAIDVVVIALIYREYRALEAEESSDAP
jgi:uncharacterized membrane protein